MGDFSIIDSEDLIRDYVPLLATRQATVFVGAGISLDSGFPLWSELMEKPARLLNASKADKADLYSLTERYVQKHGRNYLNDLLIQELRKDCRPNQVHKILARLPFSEYWTTNYDKLIEASLREVGKGVNSIYKDEQFTHKIIDRIKLYKIHGCIDDIGNAVVTRSDVERYHIEYYVMLQSFFAALAKKTFLFIGFGFNDQNFRTIIGKLRVIYKNKGRVHYAILKEPEESEKEAFSLFCQDLNQYGIKVCSISSYEEVNTILSAIEMMYLRKNIFFAGSYKKFPAMLRDADKSLTNYSFKNKIKFQSIVKDVDVLSYGALLERIGEEVIDRGYNLHTGFGIGACDVVAEGAAKYYAKRDLYQQIYDRIFVFPLPHRNAPLKYQNHYYRQGLISRCGFMVVIRGNTPRSDYNSGTFEEFLISRSSSSLILGEQKALKKTFELLLESKSDKNADPSYLSSHLNGFDDFDFDQKSYEETKDYLLILQDRYIREKRIELIHMFLRIILEQWKLLSRTASFAIDLLLVRGEISKFNFNLAQDYFLAEKRYFSKQFEYPSMSKKSRKQEKELKKQRAEMFSLFKNPKKAIRKQKVLHRVVRQCLQGEAKYDLVYQLCASFIENVDWNDPYGGHKFLAHNTNHKFSHIFKKIEKEVSQNDHLYSVFNENLSNKKTKSSRRLFNDQAIKIGISLKTFKKKTAKKIKKAEGNNENVSYDLYCKINDWDISVCNYAFSFFEMISSLAKVSLGADELFSQVEIYKRYIKSLSTDLEFGRMESSGIGEDGPFTFEQLEKTSLDCRTTNDIKDLAFQGRYLPKLTNLHRAYIERFNSESEKLTLMNEIRKSLKNENLPSLKRDMDQLEKLEHQLNTNTSSNRQGTVILPIGALGGMAHKLWVDERPRFIRQFASGSNIGINKKLIKYYDLLGGPRNKNGKRSWTKKTYIKHLDILEALFGIKTLLDKNSSEE